ncbi:helix-turn-helix domain-containing protein [Streptomyces sp. NPDC058954]|uniref:helix-turn-helix domain-containing protein n=1 Tax=Streptomyces sp. NPDC058954 TaxID=3346677 RepID=UPI00368AF448
MSAGDEVEEFAALLRRLKDRTDRSYGSLARRLHMNTSTLHRYCAGEAVPLEYAPVERLAAFCAATPEERLELHRLWLRAVAARQRPRSTGPGAPEDPAAAAEPGAPGATPAAAEPTLMPTDEPAAARDAVPAEEAASAEGAPQPASEPAPEPASDPAPGPRSWYRRRRVLVSVGVACALLATLGSLRALSDDRAPQARAPHDSTAPRTTAPGAPWRPSEPSAGSSPTTAPNSSSPEAGKKPTASHSAGGGSGGTGGRVTGLPLAWTVDSQVWQGGCGHDYVIDKPPAQVPPPPVQQDAGTWAATQGAVHGRQTLVQVSVQGRSSTAVVLEALRVRIVGRGQPLTGNSYAMDQGCGGELTPRSFTVNLDADRPIARSKDGADSEHTIPAVHFPYRVSAQDPEVLLVDATTRAHDARWYLELDWSSQGRKGTIRIDDHGRPFHTSGITDMPRYWYGTDDSGDRAWVPYDS